jgi:hypothetical protein
MKEEGRTSKRPLKEAFGEWSNAKIALLRAAGRDRRRSRGLVWGPILRPDQINGAVTVLLLTVVVIFVTMV